MNKAGDITYKGGELYKEGNASDYGRCRPSIALMAIPVVAGAAASSPYRHKDARFQSDSQGCARIYRCSCNPVNNYLSASAKVQYTANGTYKWTSTKTSSGSNVEQRVFVVTAPNGYYANAVSASFIASCSGGARQKLADSATR